MAFTGGRLAVALAVAWCASVSAAPANAGERFTLDLELASAWQLRNDFAIPPGEGTLVRLADEERGPVAAGRMTLTWNAGERWALRFLAAPLRTDAAFVPEEDVTFQGVGFAAGERLRVDYRFDSYRATWLYRFRPRGELAYRAGATLKVRDAAIRLAGGGARAEKTDTGLVPLLYGGVRWQAGERVAVDAEVDAAAASQGRAVDLAVRAEAAVGESMRVFAGLRFLDGGADNDEVVSFATFASVIAGVSASFWPVRRRAAPA